MEDIVIRENQKSVGRRIVIQDSFVVKTDFC